MTIKQGLYAWLHDSITEMFLHIHSILVCFSVPVSPLNVLIVWLAAVKVEWDQSCPVVRSRGAVMNNMNTIRHAWVDIVDIATCLLCMSYMLIMFGRAVHGSDNG